MSAYALILWTAIAVSTSGEEVKDWRQLASFEDRSSATAMVMCEAARTQLKVKERAKCIQVK